MTIENDLKEIDKLVADLFKNAFSYKEKVDMITKLYKVKAELIEVDKKISKEDMFELIGYIVSKVVSKGILIRRYLF